MKEKDITKQADIWVSEQENQNHVYAKNCSRDAFIAGAKWMANYLCHIPFTQVMTELHTYIKERMTNEN